MARPRNVTPRFKLVTRGGRFYARWWIDGAWQRKSLNTSDREIAEDRLREMIGPIPAETAGRDDPVKFGTKFQQKYRFKTEDQIVSSRKKVPYSSGVYFLIRLGRVVYVGQSLNVFGRVGQHVIKGKEFDYWHFEPCDPEDLNWLERHYINAFRPILNRRLALVVIGAT